MKHKLGIAILTFLSAVSICAAGCGGTGNGMGVLEPYPTDHPTSTETPPIPPTPDPDIDPVQYSVFKRGKKIYNPTKQSYINGNIYFVQGFVAGGTGLSSQTVEYKLCTYKAGEGYDPTQTKDEPTQLKVKIKSSTGSSSDLKLENPFWIDTKLDNRNTEDPDDDVLYLAVTDLGSTKGVYVINMGERRDGWLQGTGRNVNANNSTVCSVPLTCSLGSDMVFWTDYTEEGKIVAYSYKDITSTDTPLWSGTVVAGLSYPSVIDVHGPWGAVSCQGDDRVCLFKVNSGETQSDLKGNYPLLTIGEDLAYIYPENTSYKTPFDLKWTENKDPKTGKNASYLAITSGLSIEGYGPASQGPENGALWSFKYIQDTPDKSSLESVNKNNNKYKIVLSGLQYPVSPCFPDEENTEREYIDLIYASTGKANSPENPLTPGSINFVRYNPKTEKVERRYTNAILDDLVDPFSVVINSELEAEAKDKFNEEATSFLYTCGWNRGTDTNKNGTVKGYHIYIPVKK